MAAAAPRAARAMTRSSRRASRSRRSVEPPMADGGWGGGGGRGPSGPSLRGRRWFNARLAAVAAGWGSPCWGGRQMPPPAPLNTNQGEQKQPDMHHLSPTAVYDANKPVS